MRENGREVELVDGSDVVSKVQIDDLHQQQTTTPLPSTQENKHKAANDKRERKTTYGKISLCPINNNSIRTEHSIRNTYTVFFGSHRTIATTNNPDNENKLEITGKAKQQSPTTQTTRHQ